jgi:hypothetical protein
MTVHDTTTELTGYLLNQPGDGGAGLDCET